MDDIKIAVIGLGYVGLLLPDCFQLSLPLLASI